MLWRLSQLFSGGGDLLKAEAEIAAQRIRRVAIIGIAMAVGMFAALVGLLIALAGATVALATEIGWPGSLAIVGAFVLVVGVVIALVAKRNKLDEKPAKGFDMPPEVEATQAKSQMRDAVDPHESNPNEPAKEHSSGEIPDLNAMKEKVIDFATKNPAAVASGAFLALSIIGPFRAFRIISRGAALASVAAAAVDHFKDKDKGDDRGGDVPKPAGPTPTPYASTGHAPTGSGSASTTSPVGPRADSMPAPRHDAGVRTEPKTGAWSGSHTPGAGTPGRDRI